jgi:hypothetical protein
MEHYGYGETDVIPCEIDGTRAVDIHHIKFKSHGGTDEPRNLIALCREHHDEAHDDKNFNKQLKDMKDEEFCNC